MPNVGGKKYPYTKAGKKAAAKAKAKAKDATLLIKQAAVKKKIAKQAKKKRGGY